MDIQAQVKDEIKLRLKPQLSAIHNELVNVQISRPISANLGVASKATNLNNASSSFIRGLQTRASNAAAPTVQTNSSNLPKNVPVFKSLGLLGP